MCAGEPWEHWTGAGSGVGWNLANRTGGVKGIVQGCSLSSTEVLPL